MADQLLQGDVYNKIIDDVISASSTDFEESGVSQSTLQELRKVSRMFRVDSNPSTGIYAGFDISLFFSFKSLEQILYLRSSNLFTALLPSWPRKFQRRREAGAFAIARSLGARFFSAIVLYAVMRHAPTLRLPHFGWCNYHVTHDSFRSQILI